MADNLAMIRMEHGRPARGARDSAGRGPAGLPFGGLALLSLPVLLFIKCRQAHLIGFLSRREFLAFLPPLLGG